MKRAIFLAGLLLAASSLWAQQPPPKPEEPKPAPAVQPASSNGNDQSSAAAQTQQPTAAPKLGHPLDPHDVDVLTGKADRDARAATPRATPYLGMNGHGWTNTGWQTGNRSGFLVGSVNGKPFFIFGSTSGVPAPFFFGRGRSRFPRLFFF